MSCIVRAIHSARTIDSRSLLEFPHSFDEEKAVPKLNEHYRKLKASYLFGEIRRRAKAFTEAHPDARLIDLGVGDVTRPLPPAVIRAVHEATDELAHAETFKGYGPYAGYEFLRAEIAAYD